MFFGIILTYLEIAAAVGGESPVTIITLIPADLHFSTAWGTAGLGGSYREISPKNVKSLKSKLNLSIAETSNSKPSGYFYLSNLN